jgi:RimJ/RimL family protein N-acetyltransferase
MKLTLKPLLDKDIELFYKWLDKDYIYKWLCPDGEEYREAWLDEVINRKTKYPYMKHFIVYCDDKPIGFCLHMDCYFDKEYIPEHYGLTIDKAETIFEIGYFIGEEEYLNKGLGKVIVGKLEEAIGAIGGKEILADPAEENIISIKTLLSNGFVKIKDGDYRKRITTN